MKAAAALAFFAFIALTGVAAARAAGPTFKAEFHHSYQLSAAGTVTIDNPRGSIRVIGWEKDVARVDARECAPTAEALRNLTIIVNSTPAALSVKTLYPPEEEGWFSWVRLLGVSTWCDQKPEVNYTVHLPRRARVTLTSASADIAVAGPIGSLRLATASGDVSATDTGDVTVDTESGNVTLARVRGVVVVTTTSGDVEFNEAQGDIKVNATSGVVGLYRVSGKAVVSTTSGDITARAFAGIARLNSDSGDVSMTLNRGAGVALSVSTVSGELSCDVPQHVGAPIQVNTVSGDISVHSL